MGLVAIAALSADALTAALNRNPAFVFTREHR
jgi:hypothetical protein